MAKYFDRFPTIYYDVEKNGYGSRYLLTNLMFRLKIIDTLKNNTSTYYDWQIDEGDTIEILAEKLYGDPEYHWVIAMMNNMTDPLFDWPKDYNSFNKYIISQYGSEANAAQSIHHYTLSISRKDLNSQTSHFISYEIDANTYNSTAESSYTVYTLDSGKSIEERIYTSQVSCLDWEREENERKRQIRILKPEYIGTVEKEFEEFQPKPSWYRSLSNYAER